MSTDCNDLPQQPRSQILRSIFGAVSDIADGESIPIAPFDFEDTIKDDNGYIASTDNGAEDNECKISSNLFLQSPTPYRPPMTHLHSQSRVTDDRDEIAYLTGEYPLPNGWDARETCGLFETPYLIAEIKTHPDFHGVEVHKVAAVSHGCEFGTVILWGEKKLDDGSIFNVAFEASNCGVTSFTPISLGQTLRSLKYGTEHGDFDAYNGGETTRGANCRSVTEISEPVYRQHTDHEFPNYFYAWM